MKRKQRNIRQFYLINLLLLLVAIVLINGIGNVVFTRFDLTSEKRYTLTDASKKIIKNLDDIVFFRIYLEGEFPAGFKRLRREAKELLDEFRAYNKNIQYEFIDPSSSADEQERNDTYRLLMEQGLSPTNLQVKTKSGVDQQVIFPGALVSYRGKQVAVELLDAQLNVPPEAVLNNSIQNLEFKFVDAIHKLSRRQKPAIAFIEGHGELDKDETYDISNTLKADYVVNRLRIDEQVNALVERKLTDSVSQTYEIKPKYAAIIIAKPDSAFSQKDRFIIDQYIMYGGKVLWLIDPVLTSMDSIQRSESTVAIANELELQNQLFTYGVRMNTNLVMDLIALSIPLRTGQVGNQPQIDFFPWYYFPVVTPVSQHPIVRNLNSISTRFVSSLDTLRTKGVKKTVLLTTSPYSRTVNTPAVVSLALTRQAPVEERYREGPKAIAVLLEGMFDSEFKNRLAPEMLEAREIGFRDHSIPTSMIVVSDGDMMKNQFHIPNGYPLPLGFDQFTRETFGNKMFLLNALNYLTEGPDMMQIRSRELTLRMLDKTKINSMRLFWQLFNLLTPIALVLITAVLMIWLRKRKYSKVEG